MMNRLKNAGLSGFAWIDLIVGAALFVFGMYLGTLF